MRRAALLCVAALATGATVAFAYDHKETVSAASTPEGLYVLHWSLVSSGKVRLGLEVDSKSGWVGFGVSETGGMEGSDVALLSKGQDGKWTVQDSYVHVARRPRAARVLVLVQPLEPAPARAAQPPSIDARGRHRGPSTSCGSHGGCDGCGGRIRPCARHDDKFADASPASAPVPRLALQREPCCPTAGKACVRTPWQHRASPQTPPPHTHTPLVLVLTGGAAGRGALRVVRVLPGGSYTTARTPPAKDAGGQDWALLGATTTGAGSTLLELERALATGDVTQDRAIVPTAASNLVFAMGPSSSPG